MFPRVDGPDLPAFGPLPPRLPSLRPWLLAWCAALMVLVGLASAVVAAPGLCVGPVCADDIQRSSLNHWQLRLRLSDQRGQHERVVVDCRDGVLSPQQGLVERGYALSVARRACRLVSAA